MDDFLRSILFDLFFWRNDSAAEYKRRQKILELIGTYAEFHQVSFVGCCWFCRFCGRCICCYSCVLPSYVFPQELPEAAVSFLDAYLADWDGCSHLEALLRLMPLLPPNRFSELEARFFSHVVRTATLGAPRAKALVFGACTATLRRWLALDWVAIDKGHRKYVDAARN